MLSLLLNAELDTVNLMSIYFKLFFSVIAYLIIKAIFAIMSTKIQKILLIDKNNCRKVSVLELFFVISQLKRKTL